MDTSVMSTRSYSFHAVYQHKFLSYFCLLTKLPMVNTILVITVIADWVMYSDNSLTYWSANHMTVFAVQFGILLVACLFAICAYSIQRKKTFKGLDTEFSKEHDLVQNQG